MHITAARLIRGSSLTSLPLAHYRLPCQHACIHWQKPLWGIRPTLPISLETVSDSLLTKLATKPACNPDVCVRNMLPHVHGAALLMLLSLTSLPGDHS